MLVKTHNKLQQIRQKTQHIHIHITIQSHYKKYGYVLYIQSNYSFYNFTIFQIKYFYIFIFYFVGHASQILHALYIYYLISLQNITFTCI